MKDGVRTTMNIGDFCNRIRDDVQAVRDDIRAAVEQAALEFVANARKTNTYTDRTSNLRSSIGYICFEDGVEFARNFEVAGAGSETGAQGMNEGTIYAQAMKVPQTGYSVVVVAGMNYAKYVESRGYDVITNSKQIMVNRIPVFIKLVFNGQDRTTTKGVAGSVTQ